MEEESEFSGGEEKIIGKYLAKDVEPLLKKFAQENPDLFFDEVICSNLSTWGFYYDDRKSTLREYYEKQTKNLIEKYSQYLRPLLPKFARYYQNHFYQEGLYRILHEELLKIPVIKEEMFGEILPRDLHNEVSGFMFRGKRRKNHKKRSK